MKKEFVMIKTWHTEEDEPILISDHASQEAMDQAGNDYFEKTGDEKNVNIAKLNLGLLFVDLKNPDQAISYINESIGYFERQEKTVEVSNKLCENYLNLGKAYQLKKDYRSAQIKPQTSKSSAKK